MKKLFCLALMVAPFPALEAGKRNYTREEILAYVEEQRRARPDYKEPPYQAAIDLLNGKVPGPIATFHGSVVYSYDDESIKQLIELIADPEASRQRSAIHALGIIHNVDPKAVPYEVLEKIATDFEAARASGVKVSLFDLDRAYFALSYSHDSRALDFLLARMDEAFWNGDMPTGGTTTTANPDDLALRTVQTEIINALGNLPDGKGWPYIEQIKQSPLFEKEEIARTVGVTERRRNDRERLRKEREEAYRLRLERDGQIAASGGESPPVETVVAPDSSSTEASQPPPAPSDPAEKVEPASPEEPLPIQSGNENLVVFGVVSVSILICLILWILVRTKRKN